MSGSSVSIEPQNPGAARTVATGRLAGPATVPGRHPSRRSSMRQSADDGPRRPIRRPDRQPGRLPPLVARLPRHRARACSPALREAGPAGLTPAELAAATGTHPQAIEAWAWAADAHDLVDARGRPPDRSTRTSRSILLDELRPEYLGGQFMHATVASLDWGGMADFFRTGEPIRDRPDRYRDRHRALDRAGHRGLLPGGAVRAAPARRRPVAGRARRRHPLRRRALADRDGPALPGARARRRRIRGGFGRPGAGQGRGGRADRPDHDPRRVAPRRPARPASTTWPTSSTPSISSTTRRRSCAAAWEALRPGGRLLVLDWPLPSERDEFRTRHGELIAGVQLDELYQGTALATREQFLAWFAEGGLPEPASIDLPSGASLFLAERDLTGTPPVARRFLRGYGGADDRTAPRRTGTVRRRSTRQPCVACSCTRRASTPSRAATCATSATRSCSTIPIEREPFWNRLEGLRWPEDPGAFDRRLTEVLVLFASIGRTPHIWASPIHDLPGGSGRSARGERVPRHGHGQPDDPGRPGTGPAPPRVRAPTGSPSSALPGSRVRRPKRQRARSSRS